MSATINDPKPDAAAPATAQVPKRITNAQTVCNEKNAKGKLCNGHLKQLRTAGEASEIHLRGDDVLSKCQTCGTLYMGPPLGHVRDPNKQSRFVEAELTALLQAAGGTLPVIKKDERGVYVMVDAAAGHAPATAAAAPGKTAPAAAKAPTAAPKAAAAPKPAAPKAGAEPNRQLFRRSTYVGVKDTGPVAGESFAEKVARLKAVSAAAKQRADEGGGDHVVEAAAELVAAPVETSADVSAETVAAAETAASATSSAPAHKPTGQADRSLMKRSTYCGVVDTGPVPGETFAQKVERLAKVSAAAKQRADGG
ncbi:MAG: hypothetical protein M3447_07360 [Acidobacteriota bacterium]|nr:hypothetical protein [Acidobacteriota bacterium]